MGQLHCEGCISTNAENDQSAVTMPKISSPLFTGAEIICRLFHGKLGMAHEGSTRSDKSRSVSSFGDK